MKAEELRIGNLLEYANFIYSASQITKNFIHANNIHGFAPGVFPLDNLEPIPLTEEWLIKFGFKERKDTDNFSYWHIGTNPITHDWLFDIKQFKDENRLFYKNGFHNLKYVHQLQNLYFALTNTELIFTNDEAK